MVKFLSQSCGELQQAVALSRRDEAIWKTPQHHGHPTNLKYKPQQKQPGQLLAPIPG